MNSHAVAVDGRRYRVPTELRRKYAKGRQSRTKSLSKSCCGSCKQGECECSPPVLRFWGECSRCDEMEAQYLALDQAHSDLLQDKGICEGLFTVYKSLDDRAGLWKQGEEANRILWQLEEIVRRKQRLLKELCSTCPENPLCVR